MFKLLLLSILLISTSATLFSQAEKSRNPISFQEIKTENKSFPEIEGFNGDFQVQMPIFEKIAITEDFIEYIESSRKDHDRVALPLSKGRILIIASRDELDSNGHGPFAEPFIVKD